MCDFCGELSGKDAGEFARRHPNSGGRAVWVSPDLAVLPTLGPLCDGHALVVPREHFTSFASAPELIRREAEDLVRDLALGERARARDLLWFEHGSAGSSTSGGCGISHAHIHVLPVPLGWARPELPPDFTFVSSRRRDWLDVPAASSDYLLVGRLGEVWAAQVAWLPSQALRKWVAPSLGQAEWDWRESSPDPNLPAATVALREALDVRDRVELLST